MAALLEILSFLLVEILFFLLVEILFFLLVEILSFLLAVVLAAVPSFLYPSFSSSCSLPFLPWLSLSLL